MIEKINFVMIAKFETGVVSRNIHKALQPDNLSSPPVKINATTNKNKMVFTVKNNIRIETVLATTMDIIHSIELAEAISKTIKNNKNI